MIKHIITILLSCAILTGQAQELKSIEPSLNDYLPLLKAQGYNCEVHSPFLRPRHQDKMKPEARKKKPPFRMAFYYLARLRRYLP